MNKIQNDTETIKNNEEGNLYTAFSHSTYNNIGKICSLLNINPHSLRNWEKYGLLEFLKDKQNNYRKIDVNTLQNVRFVKSMRGINMSYKDIRALMRGTMDETEEIYRRAQKNTEKQLQEMEKNRNTLTQKLDAIDQIHHLKNIGMEKEKPFFDRAIYFDLYSPAADIWFNQGNPITLIEYDDGVRPLVNKKCVACPKSHNPPPEAIAWQYDPTKTYFSCLEEELIVKKKVDGEITFCLDVENYKLAAATTDQKIKEAGYKPLNLLMECLGSFVDKVCMHCWIECEKI